MDISTLNFLAIGAATLACFGFGALWYAPPVFGNKWMAVNGFTEKDFEGSNMAKTMITQFIYTFIMAFCLAMFLNDTSIGWQEGAFYGFLTGFFWISFSHASTALYEKRPFMWTFIHGGYWSIGFTMMGSIIGAWK